MSQINVDTLVDEAGTGPVNFPYDFTIAGSPLVIPPAHNPVSVSGATQALNLGSYNFFNAGTLSADTTLTFTSVPTNALWTYTATAGFTEAYTVEDAAYTGYNTSVAAQETGPQGLAFSSDGTKMYIVGESNTTVYQYTLATAWDVTTATYASLSLSVAAQEPSPQGLAFSSDGTKMYIVGQTNDTVYQYTLVTAWDLSTASYASLSVSVAAQEPSPQGLAFSSDGTKMYIVGTTNDTVYQYTLGTAWAINTATYASLSFVHGQDGSPRGLTFSPDGLKMFLIVSATPRVLQYTLSTAWAINTATYASLSVSTAAQDTAPRYAAFNFDGTKMYVLGDTNNRVYQYNSALPPSITVPAAVQNPPTTTFYYTDQVSYTFVTNDGGTTVKLIGEELT